MKSFNFLKNSKNHDLIKKLKNYIDKLGTLRDRNLEPQEQINNKKMLKKCDRYGGTK